ncbi:MAG: hypothetical protein LBO62_06395, partial [Endomicrobium sp.]|nr:hypothetical protein [Endomicrobium sp.]
IIVGTILVGSLIFVCSYFLTKGKRKEKARKKKEMELELEKQRIAKAEEERLQARLRQQQLQEVRERDPEYQYRKSINFAGDANSLFGSIGWALVGASPSIDMEKIKANSYSLQDARVLQVTNKGLLLHKTNDIHGVVLFYETTSNDYVDGQRIDKDIYVKISGNYKYINPYGVQKTIFKLKEIKRTPVKHK